MNSEAPWLFPNVILGNKINSPSYLGTMVGDIFEVIALNIVGGKRIHYDKSADGTYHNEQRLWECKAAQNKHYFKLTADQTEQHLNENNKPTDYIFCSYYCSREVGGLTKTCDTVKDLLEYINKNIISIHVIPCETVREIMKNKDVLLRRYDSWKNSEGEGYRVYQLPHTVLDSTRWNDKDFPKQTTLKSVVYSYCGEKFETQVFTLITHHKPLTFDWISDGEPF